VYYGPPVNNCYGFWYTTDWDQDCNGGGATKAGYYQSIADCTAPQIIDKSIEPYRQVNSVAAYDGPDCAYGIHSIVTRFR